MCCCHVGARYPLSTSSPVFPAHLSHLAISPGESLIVPPRAVRTVWRRRTKADRRMPKRLPDENERGMNLHLHAPVFTKCTRRFQSVAFLRCESGKTRAQLRTHLNAERVASAQSHCFPPQNQCIFLHSLFFPRFAQFSKQTNKKKKLPAELQTG